jgi:outer membrane protein OmpA-like peptidoglycan-associated protein
MTHDDNYAKDSNELSELRSLLLGIEPTRLEKFYQQIDNPHITPEDISRLLPEAIILRTMQDKELAEVMIPTVEESIKSSVKKDHHILSDAIFPIIGPAARKAISTFIDEMTQSLNHALEHSLSPQSFMWRLEARQTGKSFAQVVLLRTLVYRVEQIFLIHKETGLLLEHIIAPKVAAQDPALVSAMMTAIQDFVKDSFNVEKDDGLQSLRFGELTIWIEEAPHAVVAGIIRGNPPQELKLVFQEAIEKIHLKFNKELNFFKGDASAFSASKPYLEACLQAQYKSCSRKKYPYAWAFYATLALGFGLLGFLTVRNQERWNVLVEKLNSQPGIIVLKAESRDGKYFISGMRDPLAIDPNALIKQAKLDPNKVITNWEPYLSLQPQFTTKRVEQLLQPPKTVSLKVDENHILHVTGSAPRQWILEARKLWRFIPGVTQFRENNLVKLELSQLQSYKKQVEQEVFFFQEGTTEFIPKEDNKLPRLLLSIEKLLDAAKYLDKDVRIDIVGHANTNGTEQINLTLSQARAHRILSYLTAQGINTSRLRAVGVGSSQALQSEIIDDRDPNLKVSFKVLF